MAGRGKVAKSLALIEACAEILEAIEPASVRAVGYQLFVRGVIPDMSKGSMSRVSSQLTWAREHGLIRWTGWSTRPARPSGSRPGADPERYIDAVERSYRWDFWLQQPSHVEVWSEKGSVRGTLAPILDGYGVPFRVHHGFTSATVAHEVAARSAEDDRPWVALYVGDRDPSGMSMSEVDLPGRISRYGGQILIERVAITEHDTRPTELTGAPFLPWFPADAKRGDSRYRWYVDTYGDRCWELDALSPVLLRERVEQAIRAFIDWDSWERCERAQAAEQQSLQEVLAAWKAAAS